MRPKKQWTDAHITLQRLWKERIAPTGMSQEEFGALYDIGTQGMVSQYLLGTVPLNYEAAAKFARGFQCSIEDICPEMAQTLIKDILPVLRGSLRRRRRFACVAVMSLLSVGMFNSQDAGAFDNKSFASQLLAQKASVIRIVSQLVRCLLERVVGSRSEALALC